MDEKTTRAFVLPAWERMKRQSGFENGSLEWHWELVLTAFCRLSYSWATVTHRLRGVPRRWRAITSYDRPIEYIRP
jgi:hypothetical protein